MNPLENAHADWKNRLEALPPIRRDAKFWAMTGTQFLGAFNDNLFKQLVLLLCTTLYRKSAGGGDLYQTFAGFFFALPFVMFSGFAGYLSDLFPKRNVIVLCKVAEILVMFVGAVAFYTMNVYFLFAVLFFMGVQSAFFGPSKYGALPEMFRERDLPYVNGVIIMTTFLAIVLGTAMAGPLMDALGGETPQDSMLWLASSACVLTALLGTVTALFVRNTPIASPGLKFRWATLAIDGPTWRLMRRDKTIRNVLYVLTVFWMIGAVIQFSVNAFGRYQLAVSPTRTGWMLVGVAAGIAVGCALAARLSKGRVRLRLYRIGNFVLVLALTLIGLLSVYGPNHEREVRAAETALEQARSLGDDATIERAERALDVITSRDMTGFEWACRLIFFASGVAAGLFTVPLQTLLQARPPDEEKGRVIAAMNFLTWIGILVASGFYFLMSAACAAWGFPQGVQFVVCALAMALMYLFRLEDQPPAPAAPVRA